MFVNITGNLFLCVHFGSGRTGNGNNLPLMSTSKNILYEKMENIKHVKLVRIRNERSNANTNTSINCREIHVGLMFYKIENAERKNGQLTEMALP